MRRSPKRAVAFAVVAAFTAATLLAAAQPKKPQSGGGGGAGAAAAPAKKPGTKPAGGGAKPMTPDSEVDASAPMTAKEERGQPAAAPSKDAGTGGGVAEQKTLDGGARVFTFREVEVEGRLKSPQIVYFLRRVRAEFAAGDLGHRSFMRELGETRNESAF